MRKKETPGRIEMKLTVSEVHDNYEGGEKQYSNDEGLFDLEGLAETES